MVVAALAAGQFLVGLDASVATVALPRIQRDLDATAPQLQWVLMAYVVAGAALALPVGALGDRVGRKKLYVIGAGIFAVGSLASALAPSMTLLIGARAVQGIGAAALGSLALAMLTTAVPKDAIGAVVGMWTAVSTAAMALGPLIGGLLVQSIGWRWVFGINVPLAVGVLVVAAAKLPGKEVRVAGKLEWVGSALLTVALISVSLGLNNAEKVGFLSSRVVIPVVIGIAVVAVAAIQQRSTDNKMLDWSQLRRRPVPAALVLSMLLGLALSGSLFQLTLLLQNALGFSPAECGLITVGATVSFIVLSPLSGKFANKIGLGRLTFIGLALASLGMLLLSRVDDSTAAITIALDLGVLGAGLGTAMPAVSAATMSAVDKDAAGSASGALNLAAQVASVLGIAIIGSIAMSRIGATWDAAADHSKELLALRPKVVAGDFEAVRKAAGAADARHAAKVFTSGVADAFRIGAMGLAVAAVAALWLLRGTRSGDQDSTEGAPGHHPDAPGAPTHAVPAAVTSGVRHA
ncbi:MAG: MFS transporter [Actinomycetia bacterium]|nr:MFS transporter [Actinomycetes bacterium]